MTLGKFYGTAKLNNNSQKKMSTVIILKMFKIEEKIREIRFIKKNARQRTTINNAIFFKLNLKFSI